MVQNTVESLYENLYGTQIRMLVLIQNTVLQEAALTTKLVY